MDSNSLDGMTTMVIVSLTACAALLWNPPHVLTLCPPPPRHTRLTQTPPSDEIINPHIHRPRQVLLQQQVVVSSRAWPVLSSSWPRRARL